MKQNRTHKFRISGFLVGPIWWPNGAECWKNLNYDLSDMDSRFSDPGSLRDHILHATIDGDFQNCTIAQGELIATRHIFKHGRQITESRSWPLDFFPSIADCLHPDPEWWPDWDDE